jgi:hypothetical protein
MPISTSAYDKGYEAWGQFKTLADNPFNPNSLDGMSWAEGWKAADAEDAEAQNHAESTTY